MEQLHLPGMEPEHNHGPNGEHYDMPVPQQPQTIEAMTAFTVVIMPDGTAIGYTDMNLDVRVQRPATMNDMYGAAALIMKDIEVMQQGNYTANAVINGQLQMAKQAQDAQLAQQIMMPNRQQRRH